MRYGEFIFCNTNSLCMDEKISLLRDCKDISYEWNANTLDCNISTSRQHFDCTFEEILGYLKEDSHVVVINRGTWGSPIGNGREHFEVGFRAMSLPVDYFLFIQIDSDKMPPVLEKYRLDYVSKRT